jgi:hypothetical protein
MVSSRPGDRLSVQARNAYPTYIWKISSLSQARCRVAEMESCLCPGVICPFPGVIRKRSIEKKGPAGNHRRGPSYEVGDYLRW